MLGRYWSNLRALVSAAQVPVPLCAALVCLVGCVGPSWAPPPPRGQTYEYDFQGFKRSSTTVVAGSGPRFNYGAAFHFRSNKGVREGEPGQDPFTQSARIDGIHFNDHLQGQGARLMPSGPAPLTPSVAPSPSNNNANSNNSPSPAPDRAKQPRGAGR